MNQVVLVFINRKSQLPFLKVRLKSEDFFPAMLLPTCHCPDQVKVSPRTTDLPIKRRNLPLLKVKLSRNVTPSAQRQQWSRLSESFSLYRLICLPDNSEHFSKFLSRSLASIYNTNLSSIFGKR